MSIERASRAPVRRALREGRTGGVGPATGRPIVGTTLGAMAESDLADAIVFLQARAGEALRLLREHDVQGSLEGPLPSEGPVPGERDSALIHLDAVAESASELRALRVYLQNYADQIDPVTGSDGELLSAADVLRRLMEAVYQQPITFDSEERPAGHDEVDWHDRLDRARTDARVIVDDEARRKTSADSWDVQNQTDDAISLTGRGHSTFIVPAFGSREFDRDPRTAFENVDGLVACNKIRVKENTTPRQTALLLVLGFEFWVVPLFVVAALIWGDASWWLVGPAVLVAIPVLVAVFGRDTVVREVAWGALKSAPRSAMNLLSLLLVLFFAVVLPAVTIFLGADLYDVVERARTGSVADGGRDDLTLLARGTQLLFIATASMLPGLLYFQFDREHLRTIEQKFTRQVFRLDPRVETKPALLAKYGFLMDEVFGRSRPARGGRLLPGKLSPIVVATIVIVLGWLVTLLNPQIGTVADQADIVSLFQPHESAVTFAFLGAYLYTLGALLRGYVRRDLRPKSYTDITVRILTVVALAWLLEVLFPDAAPLLLVFAFATGLVPQIAFTLLRETVQSSDAARGGGRLGQFWKRRGSEAKGDEYGGSEAGARERCPDELLALDDPLLLTYLEGIDLYDRARLASEGITNIEALAHSDLVELMVQTRIPAPQLVDWVDQAILYLHAPQHRVADEASSYEVLRGTGIRNATDLIRASHKAKKRAEEAKRKNGAVEAKSENAFLQILGRLPHDGPERMSVLLDAIEDEEWISNLLYWRWQSDLDNPEVQGFAECADDLASPAQSGDSTPNPDSGTAGAHRGRDD